MDFPLDPPDAENVARGGGDFGRYRGRYSAYHAGEDWWLSQGRSSFGAPVYSIGHGRVTYADPNGWGRDKGVVIVRHTFADGQTILSFYGHLDPPSVILQPGDCVTRGQHVGDIGRPRSTPHLHFEIRNHMPGEPGGGYWAEDPTLAGWEAPSPYIWNVRIMASPGVAWNRPAVGDGTVAIGPVGDHSLVILEDDQVSALQVEDGGLAWTLEYEEEVDRAILDAARPMLYTADQLGRLAAFRLPGEQDGAGAEPDFLWDTDLDAVGFPTLISLPGGGLVLSFWEQLFAVSQAGRVLWEADEVGRPLDWVVAGEQLVLSTAGGEHDLWLLDTDGLAPFETPLSGQLAAGPGDRPLLLAVDGLYRLDPTRRAAERLLELPQSLPNSGAILALADGGLLLVHQDRFDTRLMALEEDGALRWERSLAEVVGGQLSLMSLGERVLLLAQDGRGGAAELTILAVDLEEASLTRLFEGGTRSAILSLTAAYSAGQDHLLVNIGGGSLLALDVTEAESGITP
jgi:hypothetical protein